MKCVDISKPSPSGTQRVIDEIRDAACYIAVTFDPIEDKYRLLRANVTDKHLVYIAELLKFNLMKDILDQEYIDE